MALKILSSADWHILLHKKKVPYKWQENRFKLMFKKLHELEASCDIHIIAGDVFDKKPEPDEICLFLSYVNSGDLLVTHIRGEVPPHVTPEFDFEKIRQWELIILGDLHFNHKYKDFNAYYPGSPLNTHFDREDSRKYGVDVFTYIDHKNYSREFIDLKLPKLLRKTITTNDEIVSHDFNHVIYEVVGSIDEVSKIENSDLIDKKIATAPSENSKLDLRNKSILEELKDYLIYLKVDNKESVLDEYKGLGLK